MNRQLSQSKQLRKLHKENGVYFKFNDDVAEQTYAPWIEFLSKGYDPEATAIDDNELFSVTVCRVMRRFDPITVKVTDPATGSYFLVFGFGWQFVRWEADGKTFVTASENENPSVWKSFVDVMTVGKKTCKKHRRDYNSFEVSFKKNMKNHGITYS